MKSPIILLVEDDEDDTYLAKRILSKTGLHTVFHVADGQEALDYILGNRTFSDRTAYPLPHIILLDLKMPLISGHELAERIKILPELASCLVYILSSSGEARDRDRASANCRDYFVKPLSAANIATMRQHFSECGSESPI